MHFAPEKEKTAMGRVYCKSAGKHQVLSEAVQEVIKKRTEDGFVHGTSYAPIMVVTQNLGKAARDEFLNASNNSGIGIYLRSVQASHEHFSNDNHWYSSADKTSYNFLPAENRLARRIAQRSQMPIGLKVQTLDVFIEEGFQSRLKTRLYVKKHEVLSTSSWLWTNPEMISPIGRLLGKECQRFFECRREKGSYIPTGQEIRQLSPFEPQILTIKQ